VANLLFFMSVLLGDGLYSFTWYGSVGAGHKYNGVPRKHFFLFLKECEFRFNYGTPRRQLATLKTGLEI
jgi:transposase